MRSTKSVNRSSAARVTWSTALLLAVALLASACSSAADSSEGDADSTRVTFALDWAPNTNHIGVYVARELGYFDEAGLKVDILPYGSTSPAQLVSAGEVDFGIAGQASVQMGRTAGLDLISVYRVTQTDTGRLVVLADRDDIFRPSDLEGLLFGGFGAPLYTALAASTIQGDGGRGQFDEVVLDTGAYEALAQRRIDFTLSVSTWENLQAELDGRPYREFRYQDFGVPQQQATGIVSSERFLKAHPDRAEAFVQAVARGYQFAADNPGDAAELFIGANRDTLGAAEELVHRSAELMATDGYLTAQGRDIGAADAQAWNDFGAFLFEGGFLTDSRGEVISEEPDWSQYYTDEFLR